MNVHRLDYVMVYFISHCVVLVDQYVSKNKNKSLNPNQNLNLPQNVHQSTLIRTYKKN